MSRLSGTRTGDGSASTFLTQLITYIDGHEGWEHVETLTNTPNTGDRIAVFKCLGLFNSIGTDFYMSLFYDDSDPTKLYGTVHEGYNSSTNTFSDFVHFENSNPAVAANAKLSDADNPTTATSGTQDNLFGPYVQLIETTYDYNVSVTYDRVIIATSHFSNNGAMYLGAYEDFVVISNNFPICVIQLTHNGNAGTNNTARNSQGGFTRHPGRESQAANTYHFTAAGGCAPQAAWTYQPYLLSSGDDDPDLFVGGAVASRIVAAGGGVNSPALAETYGYLRGLLFDVLVIRADSGVVVNDTFTLSGVVYDVVALRTSGAGDAILIKDNI